MRDKDFESLKAGLSDVKEYTELEEKRRRENARRLFDDEVTNPTRLIGLKERAR